MTETRAPCWLTKAEKSGVFDVAPEGGTFRILLDQVKAYLNG